MRCKAMAKISTECEFLQRTYNGAAFDISQYLLLWILFRATPVKNMWPPRSQSACFQVSAVFFYARTAKFVRAQICVDDMRVFRPQAKGRQHHRSENIGPAITGSARPAPPALSERNECVKET